MQPTEVIEGLVWLGNYLDANNDMFLKSKNIRVIINCAGDQEATRLNGFVYRQLNAYDDVRYPLLDKHSYQTCHLLATAVQRGDPVLIHCAAGINRSACLLVDFLATSTKRPIHRIIEWLRTIRPGVLSNYGFVDQLVKKYGQ